MPTNIRVPIKLDRGRPTRPRITRISSDKADEIRRNRRLNPGRFSLSEADINSMIDSLNKTLLGQFSDRSLEISELGAREGLPAATLNSLRRGAALDFADVSTRAEEGLRFKGKLSRIDAEKFLEQIRQGNLLSEKQAKAQRDAALLQGLGSLFGAGLGFAFGGPGGAAVGGSLGSRLG